VDHVGRNRDVVVDELGAQRVVGDDAADLGGGEEDHLRAHAREPVEHGRLVAEIDLAAVHGDEPDLFPREPAHQRGSDHAAMAGDVDALALQLKRYACHLQHPVWPRRGHSPSFLRRAA